MMRTGLACCLLIVLAVGGAQTTHRAEVEDIIRVEDRNPAAAGAKLAAEGAIALDQCPVPEETEMRLLARAIFAVETLASGRLKRFVENSLVRASLRFGLYLPDFSIGLGQIRPSTVERLKRLSTGKALPLELNTPEAIIRALLEPCKALAVGSLIIERDIRAQSDEYGFLSRSEVLRTAHIWNGQSADDIGEAALAGLRYGELVYETFIALRSQERDRSDGLTTRSTRPPASCFSCDSAGRGKATEFCYCSRRFFLGCRFQWSRAGVSEALGIADEHSMRSTFPMVLVSKHDFGHWTRYLPEIRLHVIASRRS